MFKYYLIPFEPDPAAAGFSGVCCPKYRALLGDASGCIPLEIEADGNGKRQWKVQHYLVRLERASEAGFPDLPVECFLIDADRLTHASTTSFLKGLGATIPNKPTSDQVERAVSEWLGHGSKTIAQLMGDG